MRGLESVKLDRDDGGNRGQGCGVLIAVGLTSGLARAETTRKADHPVGRLKAGPAVPREACRWTWWWRGSTRSSTRSVQPGQIEAVQAIDLRPEISGRLVRILGP